jgi:hypothetical protein
VSSDSGIVTAWQPSFSLVRGPFSCFRHYIAQNPIGESRLSGRKAYLLYGRSPVSPLRP